MLSVKHRKALVPRGTIESIVKKSLWIFFGLFGHVFLGHLHARFPERPGPFRLQEPDFMTWWWKCPHCRFPYPVQVGRWGILNRFWIPGFQH